MTYIRQRKGDVGLEAVSQSVMLTLSCVPNDVLFPQQSLIFSCIYTSTGRILFSWFQDFFPFFSLDLSMSLTVFLRLPIQLSITQVQDVAY
jgi:hypothetical protein